MDVCFHLFARGLPKYENFDDDDCDDNDDFFMMQTDIVMIIANL